MKYISTRGQASALGFEDVLIAGLARDGGLYVPESWPRIAALSAEAYEKTALKIMAPFVADAAALEAQVKDAYAGFVHRSIAPLSEIGPDLWLMELFHGPTLAFKDVAMQLLARLFAAALKTQRRRATIVGATSGDTGSAAISAFAGLSAVDVFILFPNGRVSEVQRRQMTTVADTNIHAIAIDGTFDDCQALVKAMFNDLSFRDETSLAGINSINWARIMPQTVYYATSAAALGPRPVHFAVPTGNFGDVYAGYAAKKMGVPVGELIVATNTNDILARVLNSGRYETAGVVPTISPSMDIQLASNFERLVFDLTGRDPEAVRRLMATLAQSGAFTLSADQLTQARQDFSAHRANEDETLATMRRVRAETGRLIDPHTAVGVAAAVKRRAEGLEGPIVCLSTAHPAKFPDAVERATGEKAPLPPHMADLYERKESVMHLANGLVALQRFVRMHRVAA